MKKILMLTVDEAVSGILKDHLSSFHMDVMALTDPAALENALGTFKPDLLLIDFFLEDVNGGSICHQLKCNPITHNLPVILLTEYPELIAFSRKFGCDAAVPKPVNVQGLVTKIYELTAGDDSAPFVPAKAVAFNQKTRVFQH